MKPQNTPTVFVAMVLAPNQFGLFEEVETEAFDVRQAPPSSRSVLKTETGESIFLEYERVSIVLGWSTLPDSEILTIAVGPRSDTVLPEDEAHVSAKQLRELVQRCEALFEVTKTIWQITFLPLSFDTMRNYADRLQETEKRSEHSDTQFIDLDFESVSTPKAPSYMARASGLIETLRTSLKAANAEPSWAMQASALALSSTFVLVTPPVGIAMFTYAALRQGSDMDLLPRELGWGAAGRGTPNVNKRGLKVSVVADAT